MASMIMNRTWSISNRERQSETRPASIICPIDFSQRGVVALRYAARMARQRRAKLIVVHVVPADAAGATPTDSALHRLEQFVLPPPGVRCEWVVLQGAVADQIVELAAGCESPQIVMPSRGRKGSATAFIGRTAEQVLRRAPCPVVMVNDVDLAPPVQSPQPCSIAADTLHAAASIA